MIVIGEGSLRSVIQVYLSHYHHERVMFQICT
jgi:hypothetical protein